MAPFRIFNLDLHISVIEDIKDICKRLYGDSIEITNWSISGHNWVFKKETPTVDFINQSTWKNITEEHIQLFQDKYDTELQKYDAFIVTHTPVFALLFKKYNKPILIINTCRYDQPFCWNKNPTMKQLLDNTLQSMVQSNQAIIVSNNVADHIYLKNHTGIVSRVLPSLCLYTNSQYNPIKESFVVYGNRKIFPESNLLVEKPTKGYSWSELCSYKGIVHCPYEMSTMSIFEQVWAGVPLWFPTKRFYKECILKGTMEFISEYSKWDKPLQESEIDSWLQNADFYLLPFINYYDSFEDCIQQLQVFTDPKRDERYAWLNANSKTILDLWKPILATVMETKKESVPQKNKLLQPKIQVIAMQCPGVSNSSIRPPGFSKEACFQNLLATKDENTEITVLFDGDSSGTFLRKYTVPIVSFSNGGTGAKAMRCVLQYIQQQQYSSDTILYLVEDDFLHREGWPALLREAFSGKMQPVHLQPHYVTLYDHFDKYELPMYRNLVSMIGCTKSVHWRTVPSTVNTCAMLVKTFNQDFDTLYKYNCIDDIYPYDNDKYLELGRNGRLIMSCIPGYSTHMQTNVISPCVDWSDVQTNTVSTPVRTPPKVLMLVLASDTNEYYKKFQELWRQYMNSNPNIDCYFYKADPTLKEDALLVDKNTLVVKCEESLDKCYEKTLKAFEYFSNQFNKYDYIFRTNLSSFVVFDHYLEFCKMLPKLSMCSAFIGTTHYGLQFPAGAGFTLTPDLATRLLEEKPPLIEQDDVSIGHALKVWNIPIVPAPRTDILVNKDIDNLDSIVSTDKSIFHYRVKHLSNNRDIDTLVYTKLLKKYCISKI